MSNLFVQPRRAAFFILSVLAISLGLVLGRSASALAQAPVGVVERQIGTASRTAGADASALVPGAALFAGDLVRTGPGARLVLRLIDESLLTLGEGAELALDDMVYAPGADGGAIGAQKVAFLAGVFRYVSGRLGAAAPDRVALSTPVATIGIRGTDFLFGRLTVGMPPGESHYGFQIRQGAIEVAAPLGSVVLDEPGEGTFLPIAGAAAPTPVRQWTADEAAEADAAVAF